MMVRSSRRKAALLPVVCTMLLAACGGSIGSAGGDDAPTTIAPATLSGTFDTISGSQIELSSLEGQDVVLWFWAPW